METNRHNYGLDLYRILCCIGVLTYHIMDDVLGKSDGGGAYFLYFAASYCVPGFFLLAGFLLGRHQTITIEYIENKITGTMKKLFGWVIFWSVLHFLRTGEIYDLWGQLTAGIASSGILPVSWFLFTYCLLMFFGYPLWHLKNRYPKFFSIATVIWIVMLAGDVGRELIYAKTQSMWLHLYLGYFAFGMALNDIFAWIQKKLTKQTCLISALGIFIFTAIIYTYEFSNPHFSMAPHEYYGRWFYSLWLIGMFWLCVLVDFKNVIIQKTLHQLAGGTMVVYLGHLPILLYITGLHPLQSTGEAIGCICLLFALLFVCAECMKRLPLLRKMV